MIHLRFVRAARSGALALAFAILVGGAPSPSLGQSYAQPCLDNWDDAPANSYCSGITVYRVGASTAGDTGNCVLNGSCSITANVGDVSQTWAVSVSMSTTLDNTDDLDICIGANALGSAYEATLKAACGTDETASATAISDGLPALQTGNVSN